MTTFFHGWHRRRDRTHEQPAAPADLRLLVVDDEEPILKYAKRVFERQGYQPRVASSGAEALRLADSMTGVDVLVTDLMMPEMNGDELARQLRERDPDLHVLYVTGFSDQLFAQKPLLWTHEAFLDKPFTIESLAEAVSLLVYGHTQVWSGPHPAPAHVVARGASVAPSASK